MHPIRNKYNPILKSDPDKSWESIAAFNGCPIQIGDTTHLLYRAMSQAQDVGGIKMSLSTIGHAVADSESRFIDHSQLITPEFEWEKFGCEDPRVTYLDGKFIITYTALSKYPFEADGIKIAIATSDDLKTIQEKKLATTFNSKAMGIFPRRIGGKITAILTVHTDRPPSKICIVQFDSIGEMWSPEYWQEWYANFEEHALPLQRLNRDHIEVGAPPVETEHGWLVVYSYIQDYRTSSPIFGIEAILLEKENPSHIIGRVESPLLLPQESYEMKGMIPNVIFPSGAQIKADELIVYYGAADTTCCSAIFKLEDIYKHTQINAAHIPKMQKFKDNPVISPLPDHAWEAQAVFNPTAIYIDGAIHIIYRAMSNDNTSVMGLAISRDGIHIDERLHEPIYGPRESFETKKNPGGNSGCEDGRVTQIGDRIYMCYTAYNGIDIPRVALTSISAGDFIARKWNWQPPVIISPPGVDDKDACILPEKINGKFVILHRVQGDITIDYVDDLNFADNRHLVGHGYINAGAHAWDTAKVGIAGTPNRVGDYWLLLYHGIHPGDKEYRVGAMLLDGKDPVKVLSRTKYPILEPETQFEREGIVNNVVFPCGHVIVDNTLFVYYGAADKVTGIATYPVDKLVAYMNERREKKMLL